MPRATHHTEGGAHGGGHDGKSSQVLNSTRFPRVRRVTSHRIEVDHEVIRSQQCCCHSGERTRAGVSQNALRHAQCNPSTEGTGGRGKAACKRPLQRNHGGFSCASCRCNVNGSIVGPRPLVLVEGRRRGAERDGERWREGEGQRHRDRDRANLPVTHGRLRACACASVSVARRGGGGGTMAWPTRGALYPPVVNPHRQTTRASDTNKQTECPWTWAP